MSLDGNRLLKPVKKLRKLVKKIDPQPPPEEVHDLRTNARRFEAMFEALALDSLGLRKSTVKNLGRVRKRAGKVRDMDVLTDYGSTVHLQGEEECIVQLLEHLGAQRRKYAKKLYAEVKQSRPVVRQDLKRTPAVVSKVIRKNVSASPRSPVTNAAAAAVSLAAQLAAPQRLGRDNLHPYRLKVKELQYILKMAAGAQPKFVDDLGEVKDAIGEWHDWDVLVGIGQKVLDHGSQCKLVGELKRIAEHKYEHALALTNSLRKNYLRNGASRKKGASSRTATKIPGEPVWEAIAILAS